MTSSPTTSRAECVKAGKEEIDKLPLPEQVGTLQALHVRPRGRRARPRPHARLQREAAAGRVRDRRPSRSALLPVGIPVPKDNPELRDAVQAALLKVQESGTYDELLAKWNLTDQALEGAPDQPGEVTS